MLNIFKLQEAVNESVSGNVASIASVQAYEFVGSMDEATAEFNTVLMAEAVEFHEFMAGAEEIMTEAALNAPDRLDVIQESVFGNIKDGLTKFFEKIKSMIKGIIEKLKAFFYKLTGKTDKWLNVMKPRIEKAKQATGAADVTYEMHNWDRDYVTDGMKDALAKVVADTIQHTAPDGKVVKMNKIVDNMRKAVQAEAQAHKGADPDSSAFKAAIEEADKAISEMKAETAKVKEDLAGDFAKAFGVKNDSDMSAVWKDVAHKATGGEKVSVKYRSMVDDMVKAIEKSKKTIEDLKSFYDKRLKEINDMQSKCNTVFEKFNIKDEDKLPAEAVRVARSGFQEFSKNITATLSAIETGCNTARGMNVKYVQDMTSEYMNALTKFAGIKSKKD